MNILLKNVFYFVITGLGLGSALSLASNLDLGDSNIVNRMTDFAQIYVQKPTHVQERIDFLINQKLEDQSVPQSVRQLWSDIFTIIREIIVIEENIAYLASLGELQYVERKTPLFRGSSDTVTVGNYLGPVTLYGTVRSENRMSCSMTRCFDCGDRQGCENEGGKRLNRTNYTFLVDDAYPSLWFDLSKSAILTSNPREIDLGTLDYYTNVSYQISETEDGPKVSSRPKWIGSSKDIIKSVANKDQQVSFSFLKNKTLETSYGSILGPRENISVILVENQ